ncbi:MAG: phenylalanine--tRNA ligase subunit beta [Gammaproteobacteria bacterium]|nr:phenylalanine--tRNA ligase subunit beta [Gammaproteobacteria bacterium]
MFTFSFQHFLKLRKSSLELDELLEILNLQGLEVKKVVALGEDTAVTIEAKANRSFCLSYAGLLREVAAFGHEPAPVLFSDTKKVEIDNAHFPVSIKITAKNACPSLGMMVINDIDNTVQTPSVIREALLASGINSVNPVVDVLNFVMLETGQPLHAYDLDKIKTGLNIELTRHFKEITTLNESKVTVPRGSVVISDDNAILAVAGVIGASEVAVTKQTKSILIECASFNSTMVRIAARALKISTPSAFRFERGVDASQIKEVLAYCLKELMGVVGGHALPSAYYVEKSVQKPVRILLFPSKVNQLLGLTLSTQEMVTCLKQYYFVAEIVKRGIQVEVPHYRLDIRSEIELIGEIARIYGYHRIEPTLPSLPLSFVPNRLREKTKLLRDVLTGLGGMEVMSYSFIPHDALTILRVPAGHALDKPVLLQNPLSQEYALMRPTLAYSLMQTLAYNYSIGNKDLMLFEVGMTYFPDNEKDTAHREESKLGILFTGSHLERGFGLVKDLSYHFYDVSNVLQLIFAELGVPFTLQPQEVPFLQAQASFDVRCEAQDASTQHCSVGYAGQIESAVWQGIPNGKLVLSDAFYIELDVARLPLVKKKGGRRSVFPAVVREYNFYVDKEVCVADIMEPIQSAHAWIQYVRLKDIYEGKGMAPGKKAVLLTVKYVHPDKTLTADEVVQIEADFLATLAQKNIHLGQ